jgi:FtsP/CotA-like multicopper oxidase with cupredoxin domain
MNNSTFRADYNSPVMLKTKLGQTDWPAEWNVYNLTDTTSVRFIVYNYAYTGAHPMHLHGHNYYVLAFGNGQWDGSIVNANNPQRRDTQLLPVANSAGPGYVVIQFEADNPGVWPFHCKSRQITESTVVAS